ncbi:hypothetical protein DFH11DRAFT_1502555 [Phellopilus nigrolimitatus]|nr:hypothetical protein DFH11DRAFT_1502555 [Phellopilus nigrolimitatus]
MGNTSSSSPSKLRRDKSLISRPRALGLLSSSSSTQPLGPELLISPYPNQSPNHSQASFHASQASRRATFSASETSLLSAEAADVRRTRSANVSGPNRDDRASVLLGPPPPYAQADASSSNLHLVNSETRDGHLAVSDGIHRTKGHKRAVSASAVTPGSRRDPGAHTTLQVRSNSITASRSAPPNPHLRSVPEEFGYGVGSGIGSKHAHMVMMPPTTSTSSRLQHSEQTPTELVTSPTSTLQSPIENNVEDPLELLKRYKTIFIIDDSASMAGERWAETREALASLADTAAKYDTDGIDAYFLNANRSAQNMRSATSVKRQFDSVQPQGISLIAQKLEELLHEYLSELDAAKQDINRGDLRALQRVKPVNYIIITDGVPTDDPETVIVQAARRLDNGNFPVSQVGIQFVQVGNDPRATEALRELDDELSQEYGIRDMVDSTPYISGQTLDSEMLIKILLGGINRRVDKKGARSVLP